MMLSSFRCDFDDTAQYRVSAMNSKGELSAFASIVVKSMFRQAFNPSADSYRANFNDHVWLFKFPNVALNFSIPPHSL